MEKRRTAVTGRSFGSVAMLFYNLIFGFGPAGFFSFFGSACHFSHLFRTIFNVCNAKGELEVEI